MKIAGIIAEYNPFHNGHKYQIQETRALGATHIVAVMSPNFTQRGTPAICPALIRAKAAVASGVDLVVELPLPYAVASAQRFAYGGVSVLNALGCVDVLSFGSECGNLSLLAQTAKALRDPRVSVSLKYKLTQGITFAKAREQAVAGLYGGTVSQVLASPNNTLAVEYLTALSELNSSITPLTMLRTGAEHDSPAISGRFASASYLREALTDSPLEPLAHLLPPPACALYETAALRGLFPYDSRKTDPMLFARLRSLSPDVFFSLPDLSEGLENRLYQAVREAVSLEQAYQLAKTKRYTMARIRRLLLCACLGITARLQNTPPPYIRVLAFNGAGRELLSVIKSTATLPVSHSLARLESLDPAAHAFASLQGQTTDLYTLGLPAIQPCGYEYRQKIQMQ